MARRPLLIEKIMKDVGVMRIASMLDSMGKLVRELDEIYDDLSWTEQKEFDTLESAYKTMKRKYDFVNLTL